MKNWIRQIFKKNGTQQAQSNPAGPMGMPKISRTQAEAMVQMISNTQEVEISCDEVHRLLGEFAEMALCGKDTAAILPLVHHHLAMCPDCQEEFDALVKILEALPN